MTSRDGQLVNITPPSIRCLIEIMFRYHKDSLNIYLYHLHHRHDDVSYPALGCTFFNLAQSNNFGKKLPLHIIVMELRDSTKANTTTLFNVFG